MIETATELTMVETKWGLGLKHLKDMPNENIYNFGLVSPYPGSREQG
jgi:hypothetical protein